MTGSQLQEETSAPASSLGSIIGRLASVIASDNFPSGERAALKRLTPGAPSPLSFYRFAFRYLPENWENNKLAWGTVVAGLALMHPHPHRPDRPAGRALAESGYPEARLERLLEAEGDVLHTLLLRAVRFLAAKGESVNWTDFARLLMSIDPAKREAASLQIARSYYRNLKEKE